jgi:hypothetical protein
MKTWADERRLERRATSVNRDAGEGPPRCCATTVVACDGLVWWGGLPVELLERVYVHFPVLAAIQLEELYLCGGCREQLFRSGVVTREEIARGLELPPAVVAKAWRHDELSLRRGAVKAPAEVTAQPWWPAYRDVMLAAELDPGKRGALDSDLKAVMRAFPAAEPTTEM